MLLEKTQIRADAKKLIDDAKYADYSKLVTALENAEKSYRSALDTLATNQEKYEADLATADAAQRQFAQDTSRLTR